MCIKYLIVNTLYIDQGIGCRANITINTIHQLNLAIDGRKTTPSKCRNVYLSYSVETPRYKKFEEIFIEENLIQQKLIYKLLHRSC